jgi:general secretion pathway protein L
MAEDIFSLDIQDDLITGVIVKTGAQVTTVTNCGAALVMDRPLDEVIAEVMEQVGYTDEACRVSLAAHNFYFRQLSLPFSDKKKIDKILPFQLEETAPQPIDTLIIDGIPTKEQAEESEIIAAMISREYLAESLAMLQTLNIDPEIITVSGVQTASRVASITSEDQDFVVMDIGLQRCTVIICKGGKVCLVRSLPFDSKGLSGYHYEESWKKPVAKNPGSGGRTFAELSSSVKITCFLTQEMAEDIPIFLCGPVGLTAEAQKFLSEYFVGEVNVCGLEKLPAINFGLEAENEWVPGLMDSALATGLRPLKTQRGFNFRKDEFSRKVSIKEYSHLLSKAVVPLVALVVLAIGTFIYDTNGLKRKKTDLDNQIQAIFSETLPGVAKSRTPVAVLQGRVNEEKQRTASDKTGSGADKMLDVLAEISGRIPDHLQVKVTRLVVEKTDLRIKGNTDNFNTVDNIKKVLEQSPLFNSVTISSATLAPKGGEIRFEFKLQLSGV